MAMTLVAVDPVVNEGEVLVTVQPQLRIDEPLHNVVDASVFVQFELAPGVNATVYDGGAGGFQAGYQGAGSSYVNTPGVGVSMQIEPEAPLHETFSYTVKVVAANDNAEGLNDNYTFWTERLGAIRNSGFEEPDASDPRLPADWETSIVDPGDQLGIKRGRLANPVIWTPPEGNAIFGLGTTDLAEALDYYVADQIVPLGAGTAGTADTFSGQVAVPAGAAVESIDVLKNGSEVVGVYDSALGFRANGQSNGLVAYYKLNDDATDTVIAEATGSGAPAGVLQGGDTTADKSETGIVGKCLRFNGVDDAIRVPVNSVLEPATVSVSAWVKADNDAPANTPVASMPYGAAWASGVSYAITMSVGGTAQFQVRSGGAVRTITSSSVLPGSVWHHVVGIFNGTHLRLFLNGVEDATPVAYTGTIEYGSPSQPLSIGVGHADDPDVYFKGTIDDVRIYNWGINSKVVQKIYNARSPEEAVAPFGARLPEIGGRFSAWLGDYEVREEGEQVWDAGDTASLRITTRSMGFEHSVQQSLPDVSLTLLNYLKANYCVKAPTIFSPGATWVVKLFLDTVEAYTKTLTAADAGTTSEGLLVAAVSSLEGPDHYVKFMLALLSDNAAQFQGYSPLEHFGFWSSGNKETFVLEAALLAEFDGDSLAIETFVEWSA